jgi:hypothetical protein
MLCAGAEQFVDWTAAYRLFSKGRIDKDALFAPARKAVIDRLPDDEALTIMLDDTLIRKRGRKIPGTSWKRDPLGPKFRTNFVWGQRFLQMSAALPDADGRGRARGIPIDFVHAPTPAKPKKTAPPEAWADYRAQQRLTRLGKVAAERLHCLRRQVASQRNIICAVDGGFTNQTVFRNIPENTILIGRIRKDARLYSPPDDLSDKPRRGRQRWYGQDLPTPEEVRQDESIPWRQVQAYAAGDRHLFDVKHMPAVRWKGTGNQTGQVVIVRPLAYRPRQGAKLQYRNPAYLLCSDQNLPLEKILQSYLWRWEIELNFRDEKTVMGVGQAQVRNARSVESAPMLGVAAYAYLLLAGAATTPDDSLPPPKWQKRTHENRSSTQMMQNLFRAQLWNGAMVNNKTYFVQKLSPTQSRFYSNHAWKSAACYAFK